MLVDTEIQSSPALSVATHHKPGPKWDAQRRYSGTGRLAFLVLEKVVSPENLQLQLKVSFKHGETEPLSPAELFCCEHEYWGF